MVIPLSRQQLLKPIHLERLCQRRPNVWPSAAMRDSTAGRRNGINLSMLSTARHENRPRPCARKNLRKGSRETRMQDVPTDTTQRMPISHLLEEVTHQAPPDSIPLPCLTSPL